jgi:hypothetical protein
MRTYVPKRLSGWGIDIDLSHDLGVNRCLLGNGLDACLQQTPRFWPRERMQLYNRRRLKTVGLNTAQTPSQAPAPHSLAGCPGASAGVTATNQSTRTAGDPRAGGGRYVGI